MLVFVPVESEGGRDALPPPQHPAGLEIAYSLFCQRLPDLDNTSRPNESFHASPSPDLQSEESAAGCYTSQRRLQVNAAELLLSGRVSKHLRAGITL